MLTKPFLKIIAGIENKNLERVLAISKASTFCGVEAIDICDDVQIIKAVKSSLAGSKIKLFVSSLSWEKLLVAGELGADYLELGNYDHIYERGERFSAEQIIEAVQNLTNRGHYNLSITIPGYLSPNEQADLAQKVLEFKVSILQTEGGSISSPTSSGAIGQIEKAKITLANTLELKNACPTASILAAGGLSAVTIPLALAAGASGIGIGQGISKLSSELEMVATIRLVQEKMANFSKMYSLV